MLKSSRLCSVLHSDPFRLPVPQEHGETAGRGDDRRQPEPALAGGGATAQKTQGTEAGGGDLSPSKNINWNLLQYNVNWWNFVLILQRCILQYLKVYLPMW